MALPARFEEPANLTWGSFKAKDSGANLRYASLPAQGEPKGTIVISNGFRETIEKYFEVMRDLSERGFTVWALDWHGQGGSERFDKQHPQRMINKGYEEHVNALQQFATEVVRKEDGPFVLLAHSMGAHIGLRHLHDHPGVFDSAIMSSPMCDVLTAGYPRPVAELLTKFAKTGGFLDRYVPKGHDWDPAIDERFDVNTRTSDPERFKVTAEIFNAKPETRMGQATYGWLMNTFNSISKIRQPGYLEEIKTPILMAVAGDEHIVDKEASFRAAKALPNCTLVDAPQSKHEIWMERDEIRQPWLERAAAFLAERVKLHTNPAARNAADKSVPRGPKLG